MIIKPVRVLPPASTEGNNTFSRKLARIPNLYEIAWSPPALRENLFLINGMHPAGPLVHKYLINEGTILCSNLGLKGIAFILDLPEP